MNIRNLSMSYGVQELFSDVNLQIDENEKVGVVGLNGAGKSTFFKIIMGIETPDSGKITFKNNARVEWLPQEITDEIPSLDVTVFDFLYSARPIEKLNRELQKCYEDVADCDDLTRNKIFKKIESIEKKLDYWEHYSAENTLLKIISGMNIDDSLLYKKIGELSGGQKSKVAFAKLLYSRPEVILLDEPTNHLDIETKAYVTNYLKNYKGSVYIISHDTDFLNEVTNKTLFLDKRRKSFYLYDGNYDKFKKLLREHEKALVRQMEIQDAEAKKLKSFIDKYSSSSGKRKKMVFDREKKLEKLLDNKIDIDLTSKSAKIDIDMDRESGKIPLKINSLSFSYGNDKIINNLSFSIRRGERFLIVGKNGAGKSTLLKLIVGKLEPSSGDIYIGPKTDIGYYAQEHELLDNNKSIIDNFSDIDISMSKLRSVLGRFLFTGDDVFKKVSVLSPGERSRVCLAKLSLSGANFLVLDEPTNHLDPETRKIVADAFKDYRGTMIVVSHNPEFVDNLGIERTLVLPKGIISYYNKQDVEYFSKINEKSKK